MTKSGSKLTWLMGLVLFSAAGLVAFGLLGLQQSAERAQDVARSESQQAARALAENLLRAARDPAVLDSFRTSSRFFEFAEGGRLVVPDELTWFRSPPTDMAGERPRWPALSAIRGSTNNSRSLSVVKSVPLRAGMV